jgi:hypothetical protein
MRHEKDSLGDHNKRNKASSSHPTLDSATLVFGDLFWPGWSPLYARKKLRVLHFFLWEKWGFPLCVSSKLVYFSTITLRWSTLRRRAEDHARLALLSSLNSQFAAGFALAV